MEQVRKGVYYVGDCRDSYDGHIGIRYSLVVDTNTATVTVSFFNEGTATHWHTTIKIVETDLSKFKDETWITLYRKFIKEVPAEVYCEMIDKINKGIIT